MQGAFKLGRMTLSSLFSKPATTSYPLEPAEYVPGTRGTVVNDIDRCIFCGTCQRNCPSDSITVDRNAYTWQINHYSCVQCKCCVRGCPVQCLSMDVNYTPSATEKHLDAYTVSKAERVKRDAEKRAKAEKAAKLKAEALAKKKAEAEAKAKEKAEAEKQEREASEAPEA
ncbi:4Fe-4S binding protein [bacterium]|nr:4Fe-4S binding protein [bacterium]